LLVAARRLPFDSLRSLGSGPGVAHCRPLLAAAAAFVNSLRVRYIYEFSNLAEATPALLAAPEHASDATQQEVSTASYPTKGANFGSPCRFAATHVPGRLLAGSQVEFFGSLVGSL
jgi:hypothetical protein